jgi:spermidine/putrescine transport system substrate-binding protein
MRIQVRHRLPLIAVLALALLPGCSVGGGGHDVSSKQLNLYTWTRYVPPSVISGFEQKYGLKVHVTYYNSNEQAIAGIQANPGKYDIVIPSDYAVEILRDDHLLESIDTTKDLQNFSNIDPSFRSPEFDPGSSLRQIKGKTPEKKYTIPYQWGTTGIAYDDTKVTDPPTTWAGLADPQYHGKVALVDDNRDVLGAGMIALGYDKNSPTADELHKAGDWVSSLGFVPVNADHPAQPLLDGQADISIMYNGDAAQAMRQNPHVKYLLPTDGSIWFDNLAIPKDAPDRDAALAFMDYVLDPRVGAEITKYFGYSTPNQASLDILAKEDPAIVDNKATNPSRDSLLGLLGTRDVGPAMRQLYLSIWQQVSGLSSSGEVTP